MQITLRQHEVGRSSSVRIPFVTLPPTFVPLGNDFRLATDRVIRTVVTSRPSLSSHPLGRTVYVPSIFWRSPRPHRPGTLPSGPSRQFHWPQSSTSTDGPRCPHPLSSSRWVDGRPGTRGSPTGPSSTLTDPSVPTPAPRGPAVLPRFREILHLLLLVFDHSRSDLGYPPED